MNDKAILEIGDIIHVKRNWKLKKISAKEITESYEYEMFKKCYPELCNLAEKSKNE